MDPHNPPSHHAHKPSRSPHTGIALELCVWVCVGVPWCRPAGGFCFDLRAAGVAHGRGYVRGHIQGESALGRRGFPADAVACVFAVAYTNTRQLRAMRVL